MSDNFKDQFEDYLKQYQVSEEKRLQRLDICNSCEHNVVRLGVNACSQCNCIINLATRMKNKHCPIGKWS